MLSSSGGEKCNCNRNKRLNRVSSSSRSPSHLHRTPSCTKTMEEVWKDINLASLNDHDTQPITTNSNLRSVIFQDFLARPYNIDDSPTSMVSSAQENASLYGPGSPAPPLGTALSLSSGPEFHHFDPLKHRDSQLVQPHHPVSNNVSSFSTPFESLACASGLASFGNKRLAESDNSSGDTRHKRMIKNRESAARSRARKQAYTNELELKVKYLTSENEKLKRQQEQFCKPSATQRKKNPLYRTSTAPF